MDFKLELVLIPVSDVTALRRSTSRSAALRWMSTTSRTMSSAWCR